MRAGTITVIPRLSSLRSRLSLTDLPPITTLARVARYPWNTRLGVIAEFGPIPATIFYF